MSRIEFPRKPRKDGANIWFQTEDGSRVFIGRDYALQNEIDEKKAQTRARACFRECRTCGACSNSKRDNFTPQEVKTASGLIQLKSATKSYDEHAGKWIDCRKCEPFRFHDCHNGVMRNSHQDPEPFTEEQQKFLDQTGGKPLI